MLLILLTALNPLIVDYFVAQGLAESQLGKKQEALLSLSFASLIQPVHLLARFHAADIYLDLGFIDDAKSEFSVLETSLQSSECPTEMKFAIDSLRNKINKS